MIGEHSRRRARALHSIDCTCCSPHARQLDFAGAARRFLVGLGLGALAAFTLSAITGVPVL